jgi:hypothetical protein
MKALEDKARRMRERLERRKALRAAKKAAREKQA